MASAENLSIELKVIDAGHFFRPSRRRTCKYCRTIQKHGQCKACGAPEMAEPTVELRSAPLAAPKPPPVFEYIDEEQRRLAEVCRAHDERVANELIELVTAQGTRTFVRRF